MWSVIYKRFYIVDRFFTRLGDTARQSREVFVKECVYNLALTLGHFLACIAVGGIFVFRPDLDYVCLYAELVERAFIEHCFGGKSGYINVTRRRQKDFVRNGREVILHV